MTERPDRDLFGTALEAGLLIAFAAVVSIAVGYAVARVLGWT